jgi:heat shock protein HslJ
VEAADSADRLSRRNVLRAVGLAAAGLAFAGMARSAEGDTGGGSASEWQVADSVTLEGTPWKLVSYVAADGSASGALAGTEVTATFRAGRLTGSAGCNSYSGTYQLAGSAITISGVAGTLRFCAVPPGVMEQESAYLAALGRVAKFDIAGETLTLRDQAGSALLSYVPQPQAPLEGTTWSAQDYNNGHGGVVSLIAGSEITARFEGGRVAGSAGCNAYTAPYSLDGSAIVAALANSRLRGGGEASASGSAGSPIEIGPAASTRRACAQPPGVMEQEAAYLAALETARVYRVEGSRLFLETATGARVASYVAVAGRSP